MSVSAIDDDDEKWLMQAKNSPPGEWGNMLARAARSGDKWRVETLLDFGADIDHNDGIALAMAAGGGHADIVELLIARGIDFCAAKDDALCEAAAYGQEKTARLLIAKGADAAHDDSACLFLAVRNDKPGVIEALLEGGASVAANEGTLMCIALAHGHADVARVLLENGADPRKRHRGMNAYEWAAEIGLIGFSKMLRARRDDTDVFMSPGFFRRFSAQELTQETGDKPGHTGLHLAAQAGCFDVARDIFLADPTTQLSADDLLKNAPGGRNVLEMLAQSSQTAIAFDPRLWEGRKAEMTALFEKIPAAARGGLDLPAMTAAFDRAALKKRAAKPGLRLKPPGR
ncbi:MAG: hypothetical protein GC185_07495 [Alphaproteobacteria bacterium]|nr:hypothetical protein [Alphaproteobacteria bacterium]